MKCSSKTWIRSATRSASAPCCRTSRWPTLFVLLGVVRVKAWIAAAVVAGRGHRGGHRGLFDAGRSDPAVGDARARAFGFFPIMWIVLNAIWVYNLTVATGHFDVLRRSFSRVSPDQRIQAVIIAFCFGALLEALAGFGTPVAITVVMLMALGFRPIKAACVALIANTAPVAFGALATPIVTLSDVTSGVSDDSRSHRGHARRHGRPADTDPRCRRAAGARLRGRRPSWPAPDLAARPCRAGFAFGVAQFVAANYISVQLADIIASLVSAAAVVALLRVWTPAESPIPEDDDAEAGRDGQVGADSVTVGGGCRAAPVERRPRRPAMSAIAAAEAPGTTTRSSTIQRRWRGPMRPTRSSSPSSRS